MNLRCYKKGIVLAVVFFGHVIFGMDEKPQYKLWGKSSELDMIVQLPLELQKVIIEEYEKKVRKIFYLKTVFDCNSSVNSVAFSPDNKLLATGCNDNKARIFNGATQECIAVLKHDDWVRSVAFSPDNKLLATGCGDKKVRIFNGATQECIAVLDHGRYVYSVAFSPDSKLLATGCNDKKARIFNGATQECIAVLNHDDCVNSVA
ncbi:MAG TPA: hypothetical protein VJJ26_03520, partial [Candidatus Babeliales bacterium]|nr:hypothetical protein [Candidatus Babeliales bacterium]